VHLKKSIIIRGGLLLNVLALSACGGTPTSNQIAPAQTTAPVITSAGTDFYLTLPNHLCASNPAACLTAPATNKLIVAASSATTGEMTFNGVVTPFSVAAGNQTVITLDPSVVLSSNELIEAKGVHVTALSPISVHVVSQSTTSAEGYMALPTAGLGTKYYVMSRASSRFIGSEFALVATQDATTVSITPTAAGATQSAGTTFSITLKSGETYQLMNPAYADMTGTLVTSDKPIAVFSGHRCTDLPSGTGYCDYLVEQLPDVSLWGKIHHAAPFSGRARHTVRVLAAQDGTTFTTMPAGLLGTLNAGQFADVDLSGTAEIISNNPVLVAQFMRGYADDTAAKGDPSMVIITPAEMGMTDATFGAHGLPGTTTVFMNVVTETATLANLMLDNVAVNAANFTPVGGTSIYSVGTISMTPGAHTLLGATPYSALVYDYGIASDAVSYAYPVASKLSFATLDPTPQMPPAICVGADEHEEANHRSHTNTHVSHTNTGCGCKTDHPHHDHHNHEPHAHEHHEHTHHCSDDDLDKNEDHTHSDADSSV